MDATTIIVIAGGAGTILTVVGGLALKKFKALAKAKGISDEQGDIGFEMAQGVIDGVMALTKDNVELQKMLAKAKKYVAAGKEGWDTEEVPTYVVQAASDRVTEILNQE
ncbi:MAG: hypothetical protein WCK39_00980 [Methanomassiliicoccales archaeon]